MIAIGLVVLATYLVTATLCFWWAENPINGSEYRIYGFGMWVASVLMAQFVGEQLP